MSTAPGSQQQQGGSASIGDLLGDITRDFSLLMRQEVELAKAEVKESAKQSGKSAGMLGGAAVVGHLALVFLLIAIWWGLGNEIGRGWSGLIVAVVLAIVAGVLGVLGRKQMQAVPGLPKTTDTVSRIPDAVKGNEGNAR